MYARRPRTGPGGSRRQPETSRRKTAAAARGPSSRSPEGRAGGPPVV